MKINPQYSYGWEKLYSAVLSLAGSEPNIKKRLISAYVNSLICIREENLPEELWEKLEKISEELTKAEKWDEEEGRVKASVDLLDEIEVSRLVDEIVGLYGDICSVYKIHKITM
ncbi:MAG: hypothetical protein A2Y25_07710 [Candidatus Melainabacteria bacterium GWF2_37_15]|nr:MAG: hypothetical protein A2Y25_07710 [Candidatus Melainabacteria bacterium GWF2_37_15]